MQASGQSLAHIEQPMQILLSVTGLKTRQEPVLLLSDDDGVLIGRIYFINSGNVFL